MPGARKDAAGQRLVFQQHDESHSGHDRYGAQAPGQLRDPPGAGQKPSVARQDSTVVGAGRRRDNMENIAPFQLLEVIFATGP
ncbi:MAG: hypothetical protein V4707_05790 [Pseudomonadota bacterium]